MKRTTLIMAICLTFSLSGLANSYADSNNISSLTSSQNIQHKKVGIVLAGGGAKGVAHIGVLKVLEEVGMPIDYITGTSMGALIGALYSIGYNAHDLDSLVRHQDWITLLSDKVKWKDRSLFYKLYGNIYTVTIPFSTKEKLSLPSGIIKGQNINNLFAELTTGYQNQISFDTLPIPFACVATDISSGKAVIFRDGVLQDAMRASMSIPGAFAPVVYEDSILLVDGGLVNNYPVDIAKEMGAEITIGVDLNSGLRPKEKIKTMIDILDQMNALSGSESYNKNLALLDLNLNPGLANYSIASFTPEAIDSMILFGERVARAHLDDILRLKKEAGYDENFDASPHVTRKHSSADLYPMNHIIFEGCSPQEYKWIKNIAKIPDSSLVSTKMIQEATNKLYATGMFSSISYDICGDGPYDLRFMLEKRPSSSLNIGFRFDSEVYAGILINTSFKTPRLRSTRFSLTARIGENPWGEIDAYFGNGILHRFDLGYKIQYNDYYVYDENVKALPIVYLHHHLFLNIANIAYKAFNISAGLRYNYFKYHNIITIPEEIKREQLRSLGYVSYHGSILFDNMEANSFPQSGMHANVQYTLLTSNFATLNGDAPAHIIAVDYKQILPITNSVKFIPHIDGRIIFGQSDVENIPFSFFNCAGGIENGRYMPQQIAMPGIRYMEIFENSLFKFGADIQYNIGKGNYVFIGSNYLMNDRYFSEMFNNKGIWGFHAKYSYDAIFGPISAVLSINDRNWKTGIYLSAGFFF